MAESPSPEQVKALRAKVQERDQVGASEAQNRCALLVHTNPRSWRKWEQGERKMHPAFWELARIKMETEKGAK